MFNLKTIPLELLTVLCGLCVSVLLLLCITCTYTGFDLIEISGLLGPVHSMVMMYFLHNTVEM